MGSSHSNPPARRTTGGADRDCCILRVARLFLFIGEGANERADPMRRASRRESRCWCVIIMVMEVKSGSGKVGEK